MRRHDTRVEMQSMNQIGRHARTGPRRKTHFGARRPSGIAAALFLFLVLLLVTSARAAEAQETQTLFQGGVSHGGFGGPAVKFGSVGGDLGVWVGGRGGWILGFGGNSVSLGGGGYGLATSHPVPDPGSAGWPDRDDLRARVGYGGFVIEYTHRSRRLLHWTASTLVGAGSVALEAGGVPFTADEPSFFALEPGLHGELNVTHFLRLHAGLNYLHTSGAEIAGFRDRDFSGVNGTIMVKFGGFP